VSVDQTNPVDRHTTRKSDERIADWAESLVEWSNDHIRNERVTTVATSFMTSLLVESLFLRKLLKLNRRLREGTTIDQIG